MAIPKCLKIVAALLLLASVTLPMTTCTGYRDANGALVMRVAGEPLPEGAKEIVESNYAFEKLDPLAPVDWLTVLVFVWPIFILVALQVKDRGRVAVATRVLELGLIALSATFAFFVLFPIFDAPGSGAYLMSVALVLYAVGALWSDTSAYRAWHAERRTDRARAVPPPGGQ